MQDSPYQRNFPQPPPSALSDAANPLGLPGSSVALIVVQHGIEPDMNILGPVQRALPSLAENGNWDTKQVPGQWLLWIPYSGTMEALNQATESKGLTVTQFVNVHNRVLVVRPK